ncbi:MAG: tryptophan 7-halogenase [Balneolaceae bacterium]|nr:tryptophan 7-halogenase [Balneolaceae bacterium]MCH8549810.1 tryptophan 7-halogenase [Balneolaceae bacterium]
MNHSKNYDFLIAGSGFGGSIMALCLSQAGYEVCVVEKGSHPRFAIGESSTPVADMILRDLAEKFELPVLKEISRYGEWQKKHPEIVCGLKRGFSYYPHQPGKRFESNRVHKNELLVAASFDDENSDTNWLRSDVDSFLVQKVVEHQVDYMDHFEITDLQRVGELWDIQLKGTKDGLIEECRASWIIDATGSPAFSGKFFGTKSSPEGFYTNSSAIYSHFEQAERWQGYLNRNDFHTSDYPYNPDHSALHHLIDEGWIWMLRFNNDLLSAGFVVDHNNGKASSGLSSDEEWSQILSKYPSVNELFAQSKPADQPGGFIRSGRLQRKLNKSFGEGWVALNHTAGFVDPLHSTGIAFTLSGVERLLQIFTKKSNTDTWPELLKKVEESVFRELAVIDKLVSVCYLTRSHFGLFTASVMLYFAATIEYEQKRLSGSVPDSFLCACDKDLSEMISKCHRDLLDWSILRERNKEREAIRLIDEFRKRIEPYNSVGLMEPGNKNMYHHTAVTM